MSSSTAPSTDPLDRLARVLSRLTLVGGVIGLSLLAFVAAVHVHDSYSIDHVAGSWMALARAVNDGTLYPALHTATTWGGTRYMPIQFVLNAGAARVTGEYVTSGKLLNGAAAAGLVILVYASLRRERVPRSLAVGGAALLGVAPLGLFAFTSVHGDTLPVVLQIGAVLLTLRGTRRAVAVAGVLCALAFLTKLTALWAPAAIVVWLWLHRRDLLLRFLLPLLVTTLTGLAIFGFWSSGRIFENVVGLSFSGSDGLQALVLDAPQRVVDLLQFDGGSVFALVPVALLVVGIRIVRREPTLWDLSLLFALLGLLVVQTDVGTSSNHLLDVSSLLVITAGSLVAEGERARLRPLAESALACALIWGLVVGGALTMIPASKDALKTILDRQPGRYSLHPARSALPAGGLILSEDPAVPILRGETPLVIDPFMLLRLGNQHPEWRKGLVRQVAQHRFSRVVLLKRLDPSDPWWAATDLGQPVAAAIARAYRLHSVVGAGSGQTLDARTLWIYAPR